MRNSLLRQCTQEKLIRELRSKIGNAGELSKGVISGDPSAVLLRDKAAGLLYTFIDSQLFYVGVVVEGWDEGAQSRQIFGFIDLRVGMSIVG